MADGASVGAGLAAAASWGAGDYAGGLATRRASVWRVVLVSQGRGLVLTLAIVLLWGDPLPPLSHLAIGVAAGAAGALGIVGLYSALAAGQMGVAAPITAVVGAILPVAVGAAVEGAPSGVALAGIALALPGIWLLARPDRGGPLKGSRRALVLAIASGAGFGGFFVLLDLASAASIAWPLFAARLATFSGVAVIVLVRRDAGRDAAGPATAPARTPWGLAAVAGVGDTAGNLFFLLAATWGRLDVAAVLASLYPAFTVLLARVLLKERLSAGQVAGLGLTLAAVALMSL